MARRRKPEELVQEASAKILEETKSKPKRKQVLKTETKRPKDAVLGYMRERYGYF